MEQLKLNTILNNSTLLITDDQGIINFASNDFCTLSGYRRDELLGQKVSLLSSGKHDKQLYEFMWKTIREGHTWKGEIRNRNKQGDFFWVDLSIFPIPEKNGEGRQYIAIYNDISQQKQLIETLKQRSQRQGIISILGQLANNINQSQLFIEQAIATITGALNMDMGAIIKTDPTNAYISASTAPELLNTGDSIDIKQTDSLWGYTYHIKNEVSFNNIAKETDFKLADILSPFHYQSGICMTIGDPQNPYGLLSLFKQTQLSITYDDIFFVRTICNLIYDVITRIEIKQALEKEKELTSKYLNIAEVMILVLDNKCNITLANQKTCDVLGISQNKLIGQNWIDNFISGSRQDQEKVFYQQLFLHKDTEKKLSSESIIYDFNKHRRHIKWNHTLLSENGQISGIISAGEDITELLNAEKKQKQLQTELYQAQKMEAIGMITGGITHDFNNILASILGFSNLAIEKYAQDEDSKLSLYLKEIDKAGRKARDIITQMQNFNRHDDSNIKAENITSLVDAIIKMLRSAIPSSIEFKKHIEDDLPPAIIRPDSFNQVIMHLLINARNATHNKGCINLHISEQKDFSAQCSSCHKNFAGHFIELTISDDGDGLTQQQIDDIFNNQNSGSGLSIVQRIVHESDAHILLESTPGKGTQVRLFFKVAEHHNQASIPKLSHHGLNPNTHFMIVDDENSVATFLGEFINSQGCKSSVFTDATLALKTFKESPQQYDILITDQTMPGLCGDELVKEIRQIRAELPVILCTGNSDHIDKSTAESLNIQVFLHKPFEKEDLLNSIYQLSESL